MNERTLQAVRDYLRDRFPSGSFTDEYVARRHGQAFRIERGGKLVGRFTISEELLDDHLPEQIPYLLQDFHLLEVLEEAGVLMVSVTSRGAHIEVDDFAAGEADTWRRHPRPG
jgi:hypothetical protein